MTDDQKTSPLVRLLREKVGDLALRPAATSPDDYEEAFRNAARSARVHEDQVLRNELRMLTNYADLVDQPAGRRETVLQNSSPTTLTVFAHALMRQSFAHRFDNPTRSLALAQLAHRALQELAGSNYLSPETYADLEGEALCHLANAKRITSDVLGAERDLIAAKKALARGTGDRILRADFLSFLASLRGTQHRGDEAAALLDREIALRRLLGDPDALATALIDRGRCACLSGPDLDLANKLMKEGVELTSRNDMVLQAIYSLAQAWAREGDGLAAWKLLCAGDLVTVIAKATGERRRVRCEWVRGITYRACGEFNAAAHTLTEVREALLEQGQPLLAALASLDLMAVFAAQNRPEKILELAEWVYPTFVAEQLEQQALAVYLIAHRAATELRLTEELAVRVVNFILHHQHDHAATFDE